MKQRIIIIFAAALLMLSGCSLTPSNPFDFFDGNSREREHGTSAETKKYDYGNNGGDNHGESYTDSYGGSYENEDEDKDKDKDKSNTNGTVLPSPAFYLNTAGELDDDIYAVDGEGEYYCTTYWLPSGEGGNDDVIAYSWSVKAAGYDWEFVQRDGYGEYLINGNGADAYLEIYSDAWKLYYPVGCELEAVSDSGSSNSGKDWDFGGFQNDTFGISVDPNDTVPDGVCIFCEGSKVCRFCKGSHQVYVDIQTGWTECTMCIDGSCPHCGGTGIDID